MVSQGRRLRRARERGAAVFIVVLVIAMLTAIGVFAVSSASLSTSSSGHERFATQAQYLTELGVHAALAEVERMQGYNGIDAARRNAEQTGQALPECFAAEPNCWAFRRKDLEERAGEPLLEPAGNPAGTPGSLGYADLDWDVSVELSEKRQALVAGNNAGPDPNVAMTYCHVSVNARGIIWPKTAANQDLVIAGSGGQSFLSGTIQVLCSAN